MGTAEQYDLGGVATLNQTVSALRLCTRAVDRSSEVNLVGKPWQQKSSGHLCQHVRHRRRRSKLIPPTQVTASRLQDDAWPIAHRKTNGGDERLSA